MRKCSRLGHMKVVRRHATLCWFIGLR
jgi:hypothetical protein